MPVQIDVDEVELAKLCRRHHIRKLAVFGSAIRDDFGPDSDVDVLVEFEPGCTPGFGFFAIQEELAMGASTAMSVLKIRDIRCYRVALSPRAPSNGR